MTKDQIQQRKTGLEQGMENLTKQSQEITQTMRQLQQASEQAQLQIARQEAAIGECDFWLSEFEKNGSQSESEV
jgi:chromosome segregation ATPase